MARVSKHILLVSHEVISHLLALRDRSAFLNPHNLAQPLPDLQLSFQHEPVRVKVVLVLGEQTLLVALPRLLLAPALADA